jgi:hypothetical protein
MQDELRAGRVEVLTKPASRLAAYMTACRLACRVACWFAYGPPRGLLEYVGLSLVYLPLRAPLGLVGLTLYLLFEA